MRRLEKVFLFSLVGVAALSLADPAGADDRINCANEFRSGKLYFSQKIYKKAVDRFAVAAETCPEKAEYRARYAMALAQYAGDRLVYLPTIPAGEERTATMDSVTTMFALAGAEWDSSLARDDSKKNQKFVRENRQHYWVEHYNHGINLYNDNKYEMAELEFRISRMLDPDNIKSFREGATALIALGEKTEAAKLVQDGLKIDPEDEKLNKLLESIYIDAANDLVEASEKDKSADEADKAIGYLNEVLERRDGQDANLLFKRGVAYMAKGAAEASDESGGDAGAGAESYRKAADSFGEAADMIPASEDPDFHLAALYNRLQSEMNANDFEAAVVTLKAYLEQDPKDPSVWQTWAVCYSNQDNSDGAVAALMVSKSLAGSEIPVKDAVANAKADETSSLKELGDPAFVYTYQEVGSGNQINTWFWPDKKVARSFILGVKNGEMKW